MAGLLDYREGMPLPTPEQMARMEQWQLLGLRKQYRDQPTQDQLAGYEHRAYAREAVAENPLMAISELVATPVYQGAKLLPRSITGLRSRSNPSWSQMGQGLLGIGEGLATYFNK